MVAAPETLCHFCRASQGGWGCLGSLGADSPHVGRRTTARSFAPNDKGAQGVEPRNIYIAFDWLGGRRPPQFGRSVSRSYQQQTPTALTANPNSKPQQRTPTANPNNETTFLISASVLRRSSVREHFSFFYLQPLQPPPTSNPLNTPPTPNPSNLLILIKYLQIITSHF